MLKGLDQQVGALKSARPAARRPVRGWLRAVRESSGATQAGLAAKLGLTRQSYAQLETAKARRAIRLKSRQRAAEAMECEVVYFVVPRAGVAESFADLAARHDSARAHLAATEPSTEQRQLNHGSTRMDPDPKPMGAANDSPLR
jgi:predicted DNA-binding mobile mystery protein A